jgi:hypothetical protein
LQGLLLLSVSAADGFVNLGSFVQRKNRWCFTEDAGRLVEKKNLGALGDLRELDEQSSLKL